MNFLKAFLLVGFLPVSGFSIPLHLDKDKDGIYTLIGGFETDAPRDLVWDILIDYDDLHQFVPFLKESRVIGREGDSILVEQTSVAGFLFIHKTITVLLQVDPHPMNLIQFVDLKRDDFEIYEGEWRIEDAEADRLRVTFKLRVKVDFFAPDFAVRSVLLDHTRQNFDGVLSEIDRRR